MTKNRRLSRAIADVGWGGLLLKIDDKLKRRGGCLVKIDRRFPSTKTCSGCGAIREGLTLSDRTCLCTACGTLHDRDGNTAENIRRQEILKLKAEGLSVSAHEAVSVGDQAYPLPPVKWAGRLHSNIIMAEFQGCFA